jgi:MHS family proline/betaine transporter-like MFS transporter
LTSISPGTSIPVADPTPVDRKTLRRVTAAAAAGMFVEFFDYGIYGFFASTIALIFFPSADPTTGLLLAFAVFGLTFFVRPVGGVVCGLMGDRIGRQRTLVIIMALITVSTAMIGLLPSYATLGIAAPILLVVLRLAQGFATGGESAGAMSFVAEYAPPGERGKLVAFTQLASYCSLLLATLIGTTLAQNLSAADLQSWGWRIPFLLALPLGLVGFYIRSKLEDSPKFQDLRRSDTRSKNPLREVLSSSRHRRAVLLAIAIPVLNGSGYYILFTYMPTYLNTTLKFSIAEGLAVTSCALVVVIAAIPLAGILSDRIGRKPTIVGSAITVAVLGLPCYWLMTRGSVGLAILGAAVLGLVFAGHTGVVHTVLVELFPTRLRYTAYALGYNIGTAIFGGAAPLLITYLLKVTDNRAITAYYVVITAVVTAIAMWTTRETAHEPLVHE